MDAVKIDYPLGEHAYPGAMSQPAGMEPPSYASCSHVNNTINTGISSAQVDIHQPFLATRMHPSAPTSEKTVHSFTDIPTAIQDSRNDEYHGSTPTPGYESPSYDTTVDIPLPQYEPTLQTERTNQSFKVPDELSDKVVRDALLTFVDEHCCYGSRPAKRMNINSVVPSFGLHYQLETFTEARSTRKTHLPYINGHVDGPECGKAPLPWEITCNPTTMFESHHRVVEVPHTSLIKSCFECNGCGSIECWKCKGRGQYNCGSCTNGQSSWSNEDGSYDICSVCSGTGDETCSRCCGDGKVTCPVCKGYKSLRHFIALDVHFTNHPSDYIFEESDMPCKLIRDVSGEVIFEQTLPSVQPISRYTVQQVNDNSIRLVNEHHQSWPNECILQQRHNLRSVPISEVAYNWKKVNTRFWVYGYEHKVYAPDYPHQCCCGCNIL